MKHSYSMEVSEKKPVGSPKLFPQYAGACSACLAAFAVGNILAWTSPANPRIREGELGFPVSENDAAWVGGLMPLGAAVSCIPAGYSTDILGRRVTLLALVPVFIIGWALIIWPTGLEMLFIGRFICGLCGGAVCIVAPTFTAEICLKEIRGELGTYYQLMIASGIMFAYIIGSFVTVFWFSIICALFPILFGILFLFFPDTPVFYLNKGEPDKARKALKFFRGADCDIEPELCELAEGCNKKCDSEQSFWEAFLSKQAIRSTVYSIGMMIFQQLSGVNAIIFYTENIFRDAGSTLDPSYATILVGFMEVISTFAVSFIIERFGRRLLLISSAAVMFVCTLIVGVYFNLKDHNHDVTHIGWLPLAAVCVYIIVFSTGYGPIPWAMMPEILPSRIKGTASSLAGVINWLCAFLVTKFFSDMTNSIGTDFTFWIFSIICLVGVTFSWHLPETKGKTFEQIQRELAGKSTMNNNLAPIVALEAR